MNEPAAPLSVVAPVAQTRAAGVPISQTITIIDIQIPFGSMVALIFKVSIAAIPTMLLFGAIIGAAMVILAVLGGLLGGLGSGSLAPR